MALNLSYIGFLPGNVFLNSFHGYAFKGNLSILHAVRRLLSWIAKVCEIMHLNNSDFMSTLIYVGLCCMYMVLCLIHTAYRKTDVTAGE